MKALYIVFLTIVSIGNSYSQSQDNETTFEVTFPDIAFENATKKVITRYEFEDGKFSIVFSIEQILNIPEKIKTSEALCHWINEDIEDTIPDNFGFRLGHISNQVAYFTTTERSYAFEDEAYLKLGNEGYVFKYSVYGSGVKDKINSKYHKKYLDFLKNIKIN